MCFVGFWINASACVNVGCAPQGYGTRHQVESYLKELETGGKALEELRAAGTIKAFGAGCNHFTPEQQCDEFARRIADIVDLDFFLIAGAHYSELPGCSYSHVMFASTNGVVTRC
jgi:hypothetical protein